MKTLKDLAGEKILSVIWQKEFFTKGNTQSFSLCIDTKNYELQLRYLKIENFNRFDLTDLIGKTLVSNSCITRHQYHISFTNFREPSVKCYTFITTKGFRAQAHIYEKSQHQVSLLMPEAFTEIIDHVDHFPITSSRLFLLI